MRTNPSISGEPEPLPRSLRDRLGTWRKLRCLSSRDSREVYLVEDDRGDWRVFKVHRERDPDTLVRFQRVRGALKDLTHGQGLLPVIDHGLEPVHGLAWEELPLADSVDPGQVAFEEYSPVSLASATAATASSAARSVLAVVRALEFLHCRGLVHGDVKPANILRWGGRWVLGDYDTLGPSSEAGRTITASTEGYCPPGACEGPERDLYALGKLLYELWSGNTRLEYPSLPRRLTGVGTWSREDRLINRLIEGLCHPVGLNRLRRLEVVRVVLESLQSGDAVELSRAEALLRPRGRRPLGIAIAASAVLWLAWILLLESRWLPMLPLVPSLIACVGEAPAEEPKAGLVAYYPLDGDTLDHSGRDHHGVPFNLSWTNDASRATRRAAHFNGEAGISIPEFPESETNAFSAVLWFRTRQTNSGKLFIKDRAIGDRDSPGRQWAVGVEGPELAAGVKGEVVSAGVWVRSGGGTNGLCTSRVPMPDASRRWVHMVQTWDGRRMELWIDGDLAVSMPAQGTLAPGDSPLRIGWDQLYHFQGDIDEVRLYDRALSGDEVRGMHRLGLRRAVHRWWSAISFGMGG